PADAGRFMMPEILKYRFIRDVAAGRAEVDSRPEVASPVTFAKLWELHMHSVRGTAFDPAHKVDDRDMWWYLDEHVDMLSGQNAAELGQIGARTRRPVPWMPFLASRST